MVTQGTAQNLTLLQNYISTFVLILDGEAVIASADRQLSPANIDEINLIITDMLSQFDTIVNDVGV